MSLGALLPLSSVGHAAGAPTTPPPKTSSPGTPPRVSRKRFSPAADPTPLPSPITPRLGPLSSVGIEQPSELILPPSAKGVEVDPIKLISITPPDPRNVRRRVNSAVFGDTRQREEGKEGISAEAFAALTIIPTEDKS